MRKILFLFLLSAVSVAAQNGLIKTYHNNNKVESEINYVQGVRTGTAKFYYENGNIKTELSYVNGRVSGLVQRYSEEGKLVETFNIENGKRYGPASLFDENGIYQRDIFFVNGKLEVDETPIYVKKEEPLPSVTENITSIPAPVVKQQKKVTKERRDTEMPPPVIKDEIAEDDPAFYLSAEVMPRPVGGMAVIYKKLVYPGEARKNKIEGIVKIRAFVDEWGEVIKAEVEEGIGYGCDEAARTAVYYTKFKPAVQKGKKIKAQVVVPVEFKIY